MSDPYISESAQWHVMREREIIKKYPEVLKIKRHNPYVLVSIILAPLIQLITAYYAHYVSIGWVLVLAWCIGGFLEFAMFNNSHELCHHLVHRKITGKLYEWMMHFASIASMNAQTYILFRWGHVDSHHPLLGASYVSEARNFLNVKHPDLEILFEECYFELNRETGKTKTPYFFRVYKNPFLRIFFTVIIFPFMGCFFGTVIVPLYSIYNYLESIFFKKREKQFYKKLHSILIQFGLIYTLFFLLYYFAGPLSILYLFLSNVCARGFLFHPGIVFPLSTHKTWINNNGDVQPTTSTYSKPMAFLLNKITYHVEHHDFPYIPRAYLPKIKTIAHEYYKPLHSFHGGIDLFVQYYKMPHWIYAGQK